ncbi:hypothetical protein ABIC71_004272 [Herbaspirillum seropedicae]|jgi:hypothetical protein|nr:hypothetical protein [Herbaspirillum seropedicae]
MPVSIHIWAVVIDTPSILAASREVIAGSLGGASLS